MPKNWIFSILGWNSSSVTKIKLNWCPISQIWPKNGHFQGNSRVPVNSRKIPGMMEFWNSALKFKFLYKNWVGKMPYMLNFAKTRQIQGIPGFLESWIPGSKNQKVASKSAEKQYKYATGVISFLIYSKSAFFCKVAYLLCKSGNFKRQSQPMI